MSVLRRPLVVLQWNTAVKNVFKKWERFNLNSLRLGGLQNITQIRNKIKLSEQNTVTLKFTFAQLYRSSLPRSDL